MTAADRPSVTDNARAEEQSGYTVQQTAAHFARRVQRVSDRIRSTDYQRSVSDIVALDNVEGFLDRIARDDLDVFAAGRAETTTATDEDAQVGTFEAILATHREEYDSDCGMYFGCSCGWDNDDIGSNEGYVEHVARLLATARTRPTRTIYSVQHWEDADGIRASWVTGYGQYTHSREDAEATLRHQERQHPDTTFRLAQAEVTAWTEADQ